LAADRRHHSLARLSSEKLVKYMIGRIFIGQNFSGHKGGQSETFKAVERRPVTFDLGTRDRAFERVDQRDGNRSRIPPAFPAAETTG
jgi:hypothetical protein